MRRSIFSILSFLCITCTTFAVPAYPGWQDIEQPDGSIIELRHVGDEFYNFWMNRDGQEVIQNADGYWVVKAEQLTAPQRRARRAESPMYKEEVTLRRAALKPTKLLVILVNFSDVKMKSGHDSIFFNDVLNGENHEPYGSVREYFQTTSDGKYNPHWDVWGPVTLDSVSAYYGRNTTSTGGSDAHPREMAYQACQKAKARGCDFAQYDSDNNGYVDNVYIIYAGYAESMCGSKTDYIWPHAWGMKTSWEKIDGKILYRYGCSAELNGCSGSEVDGIATFCHEFSHVIGMPDYYDTGYGYNYKNDMTPGEWSLMDQGSYNGNGHRPPLYSIFDKLYMGWASMPEFLPKDSARNVTMPVGAQYARYITGGTTAKKYTSTDTIYYLENRQKTGNFDGALPYSGMLIWRVIYTSGWDNVNSTEKVLRYTLASATGLETGIGTKKDPYPGYNKVTSKNLLPGCQLSSITLSNGVISFKYNGGTDESYTHTWMANGSTYKTSTSTSMLIFPNTNPSACSSTNTFYGWTEQTSVQKNGMDLELVKNYSEVGVNKTFYAVYRSTTQPYVYSFLCNNTTIATSTLNEVYADGKSFSWHGRIFNQPGTYYDTVRTIAGDSVITLNLSKVHPRLCISYSAPEKLQEVTNPQSAGLHINAFGQSITCHSFSDGKGTIAFGDTVRTIGDYAFYNCTEMDSITLPKRVTSIGNNAFYCCYALKYLKLNNSSITSIGDGAFYKCKGMTAISLPSGITRIGDRTFYYCSSLTSLSIPAGVTTIDKYALGKCWGLTSLNLPESVTTLGDSALYNCRNLTKIKSYNTTPPVCGTNTFEEVPNTIPVYVWTIAKEDYENDEKWQYFSDIRPFECGDPAVRDTTRATVSAGEAYNFREKDYTQSGIYMDTTMDKYGCDTNIYCLELVVLDSAKVITYKAPHKLLETTSNDGVGLHVKKFGDQSIVVHTYIDSIGYIAFDDTLETIGYRAFYGCSESNSTPLEAITLPNTITMIDAQAFYADFQLTSITLPSSLTSIGASAFHRCPFTSITIPENVTSIGNMAFNRCKSLRTVICEALTPPVCDTIFTGSDLNKANITLYVWPKALALYQVTNHWKDLGSIQKITCDHHAQIQLVYNTICEGESFEWYGKQYTETGIYDTLTMNKYGCDTTGFRLHLTVTPKYYFDTAAVFVPGQTYNWRGRSITESGFYFDSLRTHDGCDSVYAFYLADSTRAIIYQSTIKLKEITDPAQSASIGFHTYKFNQPMVSHFHANGTGLIIFADPLTAVGDSVFYGCREKYDYGGPITSVTLPKTVTSIGQCAFNNCRNLTSINIPEGVTTIGLSGFFRCSALKNITLPESLVSLGDNAFKNSSELASITCKALAVPTTGSSCFSTIHASAVFYVWPIAHSLYTTAWSTYNVQKIDCGHPASHETTRDTICQGDTYEWFGKQYTKAGNYDTITWNKYGCDTVFNHLVLTVGDKQEYTEYHFLPTGQTYSWHGKELNKDGIYYDSLTNRFGCDSVYKLYLMDSVKAIVYEANMQLPYGTGTEQKLHLDAFDQSLVVHTYSDGKGILLFADTLHQVGYRAFYYLNGTNSSATLTKVTMPKTVTEIGEQAFYKCQYLTTVNIPSGVTVISDRMLYDCQRLTSVTIPEGVTRIEAYGLSQCYALTTLVLPASVTTIEDYALYNKNANSLSRLTCLAQTPPTCQNTDGTYHCFTNLGKNILYVYPSSSVQTAYNAAAGWTYFTGGAHQIDCGEAPAPIVTQAAICQGETYNWRDKTYTTAGTYDDIIRNQYGCPTTIYRLQLTVNPKHLIEETATWVNGMTYPWHGRDLTTSGVYWDSLQTMAGCDSVYKLTLTMTDSTRAIIYTSTAKLQEVSTSEKTAYGLHTHVFGQPMLAHSFANGVGVVAFNNPVTQIGDSAFYGCNGKSDTQNLTGITLPTTITSIGELAFYANFHLAAITIPDAVNSIGQLAFHNCTALTDLTIPEGVDLLPYRALNSCSGLHTLSFPESLDSLGAGVLRYDSNLVAITCKALTPPRCYGPSNTFSGITKKNVILYVWPSAFSAYKNDNNWKDFLIQPISCENIPDVDTTYATICPNEKYIWREKEYIAEGTYSDTLRNIYGCDSAVHRLILLHYPTYEIPEAATFVTGLTYVWHGKNLTEAGTYYDTLSTIHGCDSVIALTLTMTDSTKAIIYTAPAKLNETPIVVSGTRLGLRVNAFGQPILSHSFSNGTGVLAFANDLTQVGDTAFYGCRNTDGLRVNTLTLPNTVTSIGDYAFYNCRNLTSVNIPSGVTTIGQAAFVRCEELSSIALPDGITELRYHVLYQCDALTELTLPASLDSIGKEALARCTGLQSLRVEAIHPHKCGKDCFKGITNTIPVSVWPIGFTEYQNSTPWQYFTTFQKIACENPLSRDTTRAAICSGDSYEWLGKQYTVAGNYDSLTTNDYGCDTVMKRLELTVNPTYLFEERDTTVQGMTHIWRGHVIENAGGTKVYWDSLKTVNGCDSVYKLTLAAISNVKAIMYKAPKKLTVTDVYNNIGVHSTAFNKTITDHYFRGRTGILIFGDKGSLTQVGNRAFYGCTSGKNDNEVDTIILPNSVTTIGNDAFYNCQKLTSINIPSGVTSIGEAAFYRCTSMKTFTLPEGITILNKKVFDRCTALDTITIPSSVTQLDSAAFGQCTGLKSITSEAFTPPVCHTGSFSAVTTSNVTLNVYPICEQAYRKANVWKDFFIQKIACGTTAVRETTTETICQGDSVLWRGKYYKESIVKEDTITTDIYGCDSTIYRLELTAHPSYLIQETAIFVKGMTYTWRERNFTATGIYYDSLTTELGCDSIYQLTLTMTDSTKAIIYTANGKLSEVSYYNYGLHLGGHGQPVIAHTFQNGVGVVAFANDLTQLGDRAFYQCNNSNKNHLQTVILPKTVTSIGQSAFFACTNLTSVTIPDGVKTFGDSVFNKCRKLTDINIPEGVTTMGVRMLNECVGLRDVTIPSTVTSLGIAALRHDSTWTSITCKALNPPTCGTSCFQKMYPERNKTLYVLPSAVAAYKEANGWKDFYNIQAIKCDTITIDADASISDYAGQDLKDKEIVVTPGKTLTIDMTDTVSTLTVESGATVVYEAGATLTMGALNIEGGYSADKTTFDMPRIYIPSGSSQIVTNTTINLDLRVDKSNYYPFSVPFPVAVSEIDYINTTLRNASTYGTHYGIKTYDGDHRAKEGEGDANWRLVASSETLQPGVGYILTAVAPAKYDSRIRIPMTVDNGWTANGEQSSFGGNHRDQVTVTAYTGTEAEKQPRHGGWNFIANPYLSRYDGADIISDIEYVSIPTYNFSEYIQVAMEDTVLLPEWGFFVQAAANETMTFANAGRQEVSPRYAAPTTDERIKIPLLLADKTKSDKTTLIVADRYTTAYEVGADLEKMFGNAYTLSTYTLAQTTRLAFQALPTAATEQPIPVGFRAPAQGEYTFSLGNHSEWKDVERIDLIDYTTGAVTNLLNGSYTFETEKTQSDARFAIQVVMDKKISTNLPSSGATNQDGARKFFYQDKLYIERNGVIYDATGKEVMLCR